MICCDMPLLPTFPEKGKLRVSTASCAQKTIFVLTTEEGKAGASSGIICKIALPSSSSCGL